MAGLGTGYAYTILTTVIGLWLTPYTLRFVGREAFALTTLASDALVWLGLIDLGVTAGLQVQISQIAGQRDNDRLRRLASTAFYTQCGIVSVYVGIGAVTSSFYGSYFEVSASLRRDAATLMLLMVGSTGITLVTQTFSALLVAHQQTHVDNTVRLAVALLRTMVTVCLLGLGWGIVAVGMAALLSTAMGAAITVWRTYRILPDLRLRPALVSRRALAGIASLGIWFSLGGLAGIVIGSLDRVVTAKLISVDSVTTLILSARLFALGGGLLAQITNTARPRLGQMLGQGRSGDALQAYRRIFGVSTGLAAVIAACLWAANGSFVTRWVGADNYGGIWLDTALAANMLVVNWILPNRAVLSAGLIVRPQTMCRLVEGALNLGLALIWGRMFGVVGVVASTAVAAVLTSLWVLPWLTARMFARPFVRFVWDDASRVLAVVLVLIPVAVVARAMSACVGGYTGAGAALFVVAGAGCCMVWWIVCDGATRATIWRTARATIGRNGSGGV